MKEADFRLSEDNRIIQFTDKNVDCWEDVSAYDNTDDETQRSIQEKPRRSAKIKALGHAHKPDDSMKERSLGEADKKIVKEPGDVQIESAPQVNTLAPVTPERTQDEGGVQPGQKKMNHRFAGGSDKKSKERLRERAKVLVVAHDSVADDTDGSVEGWEEQPPQVEAPGFPPSESRPPTPSDEAPTERASPQLDFPPDEE
ncbi:hypothetical protein CPB83DRAFT_557992 [Crepidotus variabilis]|uniref:Uncharacterized protein n=1 Tax=Crepidotus variabilis TaxID=179855 RepID=A0A9P6EAH3_9AGAR|nr:hypothetical protein CPB83DRAFT_557992 [Crepidotus variabilis]